MTGAEMLQAERLAIGYPGFVLARDIDLTVAPGEVLALLGPNGGGKTTLFKTLMGLLAAKDGVVKLNGEALTALSRRAIARRLAYVPQTHAPPFPYLVRDVVLMGRTAHLGPFDAPRRGDLAAVEAALGLLGVADLAGKEYTRISGGQRQLVMIARALAQEAPLLVMDEPTASLDFGNQALVLREVRRLAARGYGIVLSTHDPDHAFACATRVAVLHRGSLAVQGAPEKVLTAELLRAVYDVKVTIQHLPSGQTVCVPDLGA